MDKNGAEFSMFLCSYLAEEMYIRKGVDILHEL